MPIPKKTSPGQPVAVLGAGDLVSHVQRADDSRGDANYRFNIFRLCEEMQATHEFRPADLRDLVKLCQILAFTITDDGWLPIDAQHVLLELFEDLDELTKSWSDRNDG